MRELLDMSFNLNKSLRSKREKVLGELTWFQFTKYQAFRQYADTLSDDQIRTITTRKKTLRLIEECRYIRETILKLEIRISTERIAA